MTTTTLEIARRYVAAGLSVIPIRPDGSKAPAVPSWNQYRERRPTPQELEQWFGNGHLHGIGLVCGRISRNLEVLDFDSETAWEEWRARVGEKELAGIPRVHTPAGGHHLYLFRETAGPNRKLAKDPSGKTLIEVKGEGGYVLAPGCPPECHPSGRTYEFEVSLPGI
jgi:hypothetical protein